MKVVNIRENLITFFIMQTLPKVQKMYGMLAMTCTYNVLYFSYFYTMSKFLLVTDVIQPYRYMYRYEAWTYGQTHVGPVFSM